MMSRLRAQWSGAAPIPACPDGLAVAPSRIRKHKNELCRDVADLNDDDADFTSTPPACARQLNAEQLINLILKPAGQQSAEAV